MAATKAQKTKLTSLTNAMGSPDERVLTDGAVHCIIPGCEGWATKKYVATIKLEDGSETREGLCPRIAAHKALIAADPDLKPFLRLGMQVRDLAAEQNKA